MRLKGGRLVAVVAVAIAVVAGAWWSLGGASGMPGDLRTLLSPGAGVMTPAPADLPAPTAEVVALADEAHLSDAGRALFYGARPVVLDASAFAGRCAAGQTAQPRPAGSAVGCYEPATGTILVYQPADARLRGFVVETAAHETLHAAWERLTADERATLTPLLEAELATLPAEHEIHEQIAGSVGSHPENRPTELFAYLGTQVWRDGGLAPGLEEAYARTIADRAALVAVHTGWVAMLAQMRADIDAASQSLVAQETTNAQARAQLDADTSSSDYYRRSYDDQVAELAAMSPESQEQVRLSWAWWDGTDLPLAPAQETLDTAADLLARDEADLAARTTDLQAAEGSAAAERARIDGVIADLNALQAQMDPGAPTA